MHNKTDTAVSQQPNLVHCVYRYLNGPHDIIIMRIVKVNSFKVLLFEAEGK